MNLSSASKTNTSCKDARFNPEKYLSVTWRMGGRVYPILDCYGVIHEVRRDLGLPDWPVFEGVINEGSQMNDTCNSFRNKVLKCEPEEGAVAACYTAGLVTHLGIAVNVNGVLHVLEANPKRNVTILPLARFLRQYVKVEFYK
ncbi:nitrite transporter [Escherichia coli]|uniref:nitrite transporter n=1 Tax=Escherichia coli TaxID=562 RepID=UPI003B5B0F59